VKVEIKEIYTGNSFPHFCHAEKDGSCNWLECPQLRDAEPQTTGRDCPYWNDVDELMED
jgi:hypothetical protein